MNISLIAPANTLRALVGLCCVGSALLLAACGGGGEGGNGSGSKSLDLVIGNSLPLSGISRDLGSSGEKASSLALKQIKKAIEETDADHTVRITQDDQGSDADSASQAARRLVDEGGANCLTGPWTPDAVLSTAKDVAIPSKVLEISPISSSEDVAGLKDHDLVDSTALPESAEGSALAKAVEEGLGGAQGETVNVAASDDSYGDTITQDFIEEWQDKDGTVGAQVALAPPPNSSSQASQVTSGDPDAILLIDDIAGFSSLAPTLSSSSGWSSNTTWGSDQLVSPGVPNQVGAEVVTGMRVLAPGMPTDEDPTTAFIQDFKAAQPRNVKLAPYAAQEFDATVLCYLAAVAAGSTDGQQMADELIDITAPGGEEFTWQQLPDAIKALEDGKDIDYTGASGPIDMDVHGDPTTGVFNIYRYSPDGLQDAGEVSVSKPNPATP